MLESTLSPSAAMARTAQGPAPVHDHASHHLRGAVLLSLLLSLPAMPLPAAAAGPPGDYGDAPYGIDAYPPKLVMGHFPTCWGSVDGAIIHLGGPLTVHFGHVMDYEPDGNARRWRAAGSGLGWGREC